jgi:hypothetical protein
VPAPSSFDYAIVRLVPRVEREEFLNVGAVVFCRTRRFLDASIDLDERRLSALAPNLDIAEVERHLAIIPLLCKGGPEGGPIGLLSQAERFHWLVAPRSTVIQTSPVHCGLCTEPAEALERIMRETVRIHPPGKN